MDAGPISPALLERLAASGPRYTSYPTAPEWRDAFGPADGQAAYQRASQRVNDPLSIYVHLPFCERLCLYCGCTVEITSRQDRADSYLDAVEREVDLVGAALGDRKGVVQLHWGGGTPTFLSPVQIRRLFEVISSRFDLLPGAEVSIEVDPHVTTSDQIDLLADLGFNRVSMGVQDLDAVVQETVRRQQTTEETRALVERCRAKGIEGINMDLMYGLPEQSEEGFASTLEEVVRLSPDRLAVFGYAHVPWLKPAQKALEAYAMPGPEDRAHLFGLALQHLTEGDYLVIGLDHFARRDDAMAKALSDGTLHRNFMGYAVMPGRDMVGFGMSAIGDMDGSFLQNVKTTGDYQAALEAGQLPTSRGLKRSSEDELRRQVILSLMCRMRIDLDEIEEESGQEPLAEHFSEEWGRMSAFAEDGLCTLSSRRIEVTETGRLFLRHMAMVFDAYLGKDGSGDRDGPRFSQTV